MSRFYGADCFHAFPADVEDHTDRHRREWPIKPLTQEHAITG